MVNAWKVIWSENKKKFLRKFEGDSPAEAVSFAKGLKSRGLSVEVISGRKAFKPKWDKVEPPGPGMWWCPYCIKWREFREFAVRDANGVIGPEYMRCPVCTISIFNYWVALFNPSKATRFLHS